MYELFVIFISLSSVCRSYNMAIPQYSQREFELSSGKSIRHYVSFPVRAKYTIPMTITAKKCARPPCQAKLRLFKPIHPHTLRRPRSSVYLSRYQQHVYHVYMHRSCFQAGFGRFNRKSSESIHMFYLASKTDIERTTSLAKTNFRTGKMSRLRYTRSNGIDMYGFTKGLG